MSKTLRSDLAWRRPLRAGLLLLAACAIVAPPGARAATALPDIWIDSVQTVDFMAPYTTPDAWPQALANLKVLQLPLGFAKRMSDRQLKQIFDFLRAHHLAFGIEAGMQTPGANGCGGGVEGYQDDGVVRALVERFKALGGTLDYITMDEPLYFGHAAKHFWLPSHGVCMDTIDAVAKNVAHVITEVRATFPLVQVGDVEPISGGPETSVDDLKLWMTAFRQATGRPLAFMHFDVAWINSQQASSDKFLTWQMQLPDAFKAVQALKIRTGVIYDGSPKDPDNLVWKDHAVGRYIETERTMKLKPDDVIFETWTAHPDRLLPEAQAGTLTNVIDSYLAWRSGWP